MEEKVYVSIDGVRGYEFSNQEEADKFLKGETNLKKVYETLGFETEGAHFSKEECFTAAEWEDCSEETIIKRLEEAKKKVNSKKVYLVKLYYRNTDEYEDFRDDSTIVTAFSKKESAERYLKDSITLFKSCVGYGLPPAYDNCIKDAMTDVKWSCTMNDGVTNISLLKYFVVFKDGKYDPDGDRNDPKNWLDFWSMDFTEFEFTIEEMEVFD